MSDDIIAIVKRTEQHVIDGRADVAALRREFADLKAQWPIPRSIRIAVWVIAGSLFVLALHRVAFENPAVQTAGLYGGP